MCNVAEGFAALVMMMYPLHHCCRSKASVPPSWLSLSAAAWVVPPYCHDCNCCQGAPAYRNERQLTTPMLTHACVQGVCTFNDDIQSTAAAVLGAIYGALRLRGVPPLKQQVFLFFGAGQANIGAARLLVSALADEGLNEAQAKKQIWLYDSKVCFGASSTGVASMHIKY